MKPYGDDGYQYKMKKGQWDISCRNICREAFIYNRSARATELDDKFRRAE